MNRRRSFGLAMIGLGGVQTAYAAMQPEPVFAALGIAYAVLGGLSRWTGS